MALLASYATLFTLSFVAATAIPMSSEPPLILLVRSGEGILLPVAVATAGNVLGACTTYLLGRGASRAYEKTTRKKPLRGQKRAQRILTRYGQPALALSWVPVLGDALVALAGVTGIRFAPFLLWVALGKGVRFLVIALAALNLF
jgi:membrane protein YqaA with SNARE-associated domain